ncbi:hypothetical protein JB92DRAFT_877745 [Gautieria morchelliformis]|nr:hypothetical protein JB92DRAFT_877745 [Gautieria morchelliformis]
MLYLYEVILGLAFATNIWYISQKKQKKRKPLPQLGSMGVDRPHALPSYPPSKYDPLNNTPPQPSSHPSAPVRVRLRASKSAPRLAPPASRSILAAGSLGGTRRARVAVAVVQRVVWVVVLRVPLVLLLLHRRGVHIRRR